MLYIVIPVFNRKKYTFNCLKSLQEQTYKDFKIVVVDDGSTDGTAEMLQNEFPQVIVLKGNGKLFWTAATNMGVKYVLEKGEKSDFILTLNNDLIVNSNYIEALLKTFSKHKPCLVGALSVNDKKTELIEFAGVKWNRYTAKRTVMFQNILYSELIQKHEIIYTDLLPGRGTLIPLEVFDKVGLYDQKYFPHYAADEDFSYQASKKGYNLIVATNCIVYSHSESTGLNYKIQKPSYKLLWNSFFSIKSPINLKTRFYWAMKNSPLKIIYFIIDLCRILISFHI